MTTLHIKSDLTIHLMHTKISETKDIKYQEHMDLNTKELQKNLNNTIVQTLQTLKEQLERKK